MRLAALISPLIYSDILLLEASAAARPRTACRFAAVKASSMSVFQVEPVTGALLVADRREPTATIGMLSPRGVRRRRRDDVPPSPTMPTTTTGSTRARGCRWASPSAGVDAEFAPVSVDGASRVVEPDRHRAGRSARSIAWRPWRRAVRLAPNAVASGDDRRARFRRLRSRRVDAVGGARDFAAWLRRASASGARNSTAAGAQVVRDAGPPRRRRRLVRLPRPTCVRARARRLCGADARIARRRRFLRS